jgi:RNA polymerase sigma factor (sigma-70 family)
MLSYLEREALRMELTVDQIEQARQGDRAAKEALGKWCLRRAFRFAYVDLGTSTPDRKGVAEEIANEASLKAITHLHQFQTGPRLDRWLHQIVRNCVRDHYRRGERTVPAAIYQRWVHDFIATYSPEFEALIRREFGAEASEPHHALAQRITTDLVTHPYRQFMRLFYEDRSNIVLDAVKERVRGFMGLEWLPLYERNEAGEWAETELPDAAEDDTAAEVLAHEFVQQVNDRLANLEPFCRRIIRWYYLDQLRVPDIARLEQLHERTTYRRLENCSATFRALLLRGGYFAEFAAVHRE